MKPLDQAQIDLALATVPGWQIERGQLIRQFKFADFIKAIAFVDRIAVLAEAAGHHPDIDIRYDRVLLTLMTHDANGITRKDFSLAAAADRAFVVAT